MVVAARTYSLVNSSFLSYIKIMVVTVKIINQEALNLLRNMENLRLIHMQTSVSEKKHSYRKLRGVHKNIPGASVEEFLARCHTDKEQELVMENKNA